MPFSAWVSYSECPTLYSWVSYSEYPTPCSQVSYSKCPTLYSHVSYSEYPTPYSRESYFKCPALYKCALLRIDTIQSPASYKNPNLVGAWNWNQNIWQQVTFSWNQISQEQKTNRVLQKALESWMLSNYNDVSCFQQISKKNLEFTSEVWVF